MSAPRIEQPKPQSQVGSPATATQVPPAQSKSELHLPAPFMTPHTGSAHEHSPKVQTPNAPQSVAGVSQLGPS